MRWVPLVTRSESANGELRVSVGHPLTDEYLEFLRARARPNTLLATAFDLKVFCTVVDRPPSRVTSSDVMAFIRAQRSGADRTVVRLDGSAGLSSRTIPRRLSSVSGFYAYLLARGDTSVVRNPVPRGLVTRRQRERPRHGWHQRSGWAARVRAHHRALLASDRLPSQAVGVSRWWSLPFFDRLG